jgi:hypothetical protein
MNEKQKPPPARCIFPQPVPADITLEVILPHDFRYYADPNDLRRVEWRS